MPRSMARLAALRFRFLAFSVDPIRSPEMRLGLAAP